jgi:lipoprotein-releasing system permease protein
MVVFVTQRALVGLLDGLCGAAAGYGVLLAFPGRDSFGPGQSGCRWILPKAPMGWRSC